MTLKVTQGHRNCHDKPPRERFCDFAVIQRSAFCLVSDAELGDSGNYTCYTKRNNMSTFVDVVRKYTATQCLNISNI